MSGADPAVISAVVGGVAALLGPPIAFFLARRQNRATAELTEAQAEEFRTKVWTSLQTSLTAHNELLRKELDGVRARLAVVEASLIEKSAQLRATELERDRLREERAALSAEVAELRAQLAACRSCTVHPAPTGGTHP
ncbi:hypothetical protein OOK41_01370 [Micromonospora sp. NBC_01655]|uniref:hypothetical protein n=1 Tax=Micromonospora sp. NBC_01655 TaxID=2975983 RepID=UPI00225A3142|nr:hypothetical protein [Micromonospora sp. NBC_01655]MCX4468974.1 hypothetical protein [Micromonospora sp. NBC_01655]